MRAIKQMGVSARSRHFSSMNFPIFSIVIIKIQPLKAIGAEIAVIANQYMKKAENMSPEMVSPLIHILFVPKISGV